MKKTASGFFITGTFWTSTVPYIAALASLNEMEKPDVVSHINAMGLRLEVGLKSAAADAGYNVSLTGPDAILFMMFSDDPDLWQNQEFSARMAAKGVYMHPHHNWFLSLAHTEQDVSKTLEVSEESLKVAKKLLEVSKE